MKIHIRLAFFCISFISLLSCSPAPAHKTRDNLDDSEDCKTMKEACEEAREFQVFYNSLPQKERKEYVAVLNTLIKHCGNAKKNCSGNE